MILEWFLLPKDNIGIPHDQIENFLYFSDMLKNWPWFSWIFLKGFTEENFGTQNLKKKWKIKTYTDGCKCAINFLLDTSINTYYIFHPQKFFEVGQLHFTYNYKYVNFPCFYEVGTLSEISAYMPLGGPYDQNFWKSLGKVLKVYPCQFWGQKHV